MSVWAGDRARVDLNGSNEFHERPAEKSAGLLFLGRGDPHQKGFQFGEVGAMTQIEKAAVWVTAHRAEVGNLNRAVNRASWRFKVNQTDLLTHMREVLAKKKGH
jgi:hypothetical protein